MRPAAAWTAALLILATVAMPGHAAQWDDTELAMETADGVLYGTLSMPKGTAEVPGVLIVPGSGPTDRDGNPPHLRNDSLKLLGQGLAARGIASLRIDKRGVGKSAPALGREEDARIEDYAEDAAAWLDVLGDRPRIGRIFAIGHSEGALVATLAARGRNLAGLILIAGPGFPAGEILRRQFADAGLSQGRREEAEAIIAALEAGRTVSDVGPEWTAFFRPSVQPYLVSWLRYDPAAELARLAIPVLVLQGTTDIQVAVGDAERLAGSRPGIRLELLAGVNHVLKAAPADRAANIATYAEPDRPLADGVLPPVEAFIRAHER